MLCRRLAYIPRFKANWNVSTARLLSTDVPPASRIRNVGILAHIDAGKTTTTERMLFAAGVTRGVGEVHDGDTTMDFLPEERARGITIQSAVISFPWQEHQVNLIDTPGHVDFTVEVERSLRVLDGAVVILDGVHGVEAQTETVWEQADRYKVPRIVFVNKMDREGACFRDCLASLTSRLGCVPLAVQQPLYAIGDEEKVGGDGEWGEFVGVVDVVAMERWRWSGKVGDEGDCRKIEHDDDEWGEVVDARKELIEALAGVHDGIAEAALMALDVEEEMGLWDAWVDGEGLDAATLWTALKEVTHKEEENGVAVVLCGASYRNRGVELLLDAMVQLLPSPEDVGQPIVVDEEGNVLEEKREGGGGLKAFVFKVAPPQGGRGALVLFRVYSGELRAGVKLRNTTRGGIIERPSAVYRIAADEVHDVPGVPAGHIGAAVGLKEAHTGDTLCGIELGSGVRLQGLQIPEPVVTAAVEVASRSEQRKLDEALIHLQRQDPSLGVSEDEDTGQTLLHGMGELHLELSLSRLQNEYGLEEASLGQVVVAYREQPTQISKGVGRFHRAIQGRDHEATVGVVVHPNPSSKTPFINTHHTISSLSDDGSTAKEVMSGGEFAMAFQEAARFALSKGPLGGHPVVHAALSLDPTTTSFTSNTSEVAVRAATAFAVADALAKASPVKLEPMMQLHIQAPEATTGTILADLSGHRAAHIQSVETIQKGTSDRHVSSIHALIPVRNIVGYASILRSLSGGEARLHTKFAHYEQVQQ